MRMEIPSFRKAILDSRYIYPLLFRHRNLKKKLFIVEFLFFLTLLFFLFFFFYFNI